MDNNLEEKLNELRKNYLNKLKDNLPSFKELTNEDSININEIYSKIHTIAGTSGMYGMNDLSKISTEFEFYLKPLKESPENIDESELKTKLINYIDYLETILTGD